MLYNTKSAKNMNKYTTFHHYSLYLNLFICITRKSIQFYTLSFGPFWPFLHHQYIKSTYFENKDVYLANLIEDI